MKSVILVLCLFLPLVVSAQNISPAASTPFNGPGVTVTIPTGLSATTPVDEVPNGFGIDLAASAASRGWPRLPVRYITFDIKWDTDDFGSLEAVVANMSQRASSLIPVEIARGDELRVAGIFPARLGALPARRMVLEFKNWEKKPAIRQIVVAYRLRKDASAIIYIATLTTTRQDFQLDVDAFSRVLSGLKFTAD
jgi:hypothetical protein